MPTLRSSRAAASLTAASRNALLTAWMTTSGAFIRQFGHDGGKRRRLERLLEGPQGIERARHLKDQHAFDRQAEAIEAHPIGLAAFEAGELGLDQEHRRASSGAARRDRKRKA